MVVVAMAMVYVVCAAVLALGFGPEPHSDWLHYWYSAGDPSRYERGGLGVWLLAIPKSLGIGPVGSALALNIPAALMVLWFAWRSDRTQGRLPSLLVAAYLLMLAPYAGIVQLDLLAAMFLAAGGWLMCLPSPRPGRLLAVVACFAAGVSIKPQYALVFWGLLGLMVLPWSLWRGRERRGGAVLAVLLAGSLLGFAVDSGLREVSGRSEKLRTSSAVTLYGGLLVSRLEGCGYWSVQAAQAAHADKDKPLLKAIRERLSAQPASHWLAILRCKWPQIVRPPPFALYWLVESPNIRERIDASPDRDRINARYYRAIDIERRIYGWLTALILLAMPVAAILAWRRGERFMALLPLAWVGAFWGVHLVFEIQGRYFLGLFLLAPMVAAMVLGLTRSGIPPAPHPRDAQGSTKNSSPLPERIR